MLENGPYEALIMTHEVATTAPVGLTGYNIAPSLIVFGIHIRATTQIGYSRGYFAKRCGGAIN